MKKTIILMSVGTAEQAVRDKTYNILKSQIRKTYPGWNVISMYTSHFILKEIKKQEEDSYGIEELRDMLKEEQELIFFPTHLLDGEEYKSLTEKVESGFLKRTGRQRKKILIGRPFLDGEDRWLLEFLEEAICLEAKEALILAGHGSRQQEHIYKALNSILKEKEKEDGNIRRILTLKAEEDLNQLFQEFRKKEIRQAVLAPFMLTFGKHMERDICGNTENSWEYRLNRAGYPVRVIHKGLLEYKSIRERYLKRLDELILSMKMIERG